LILFIYFWVLINFHIHKPVRFFTKSTQFLKPKSYKVSNNFLNSRPKIEDLAKLELKDMPTEVNVLYIHGMGGGGDSRIPGLLRERIGTHIPAEADISVNVTVRTYDFDPEEAKKQIDSWIRELHPVLVTGESLGALNAIRIKGVPHVLVSPSLNAPIYLGYPAFLALIPGVTPMLDRIYRPKEGDRQRVHFKFSTLRKYRQLRREALSCSPRSGGKDCFFAFFGEHDHYRKSGIVSIRTWKKYFGNASFTIYPGTHYMEEEFVESLLIPKIISICLHADGNNSAFAERS